MKKMMAFSICIIMLMLKGSLEAQEVPILELATSPTDNIATVPYKPTEFPIFVPVFSVKNAALEPASFVLTNESNRTIIGIAILWNIEQDGRQSQYPSLTHSYLAANSPPLVGPHGRLLVAPDTFVSEDLLASNSGLIRFSPPNKTISQFSSASKIRPEIDCVIFDDGEVVGPNRLGLINVIQARKLAADFVVAKVHSARAEGHDPLAILTDVSRKPVASDDLFGKHASMFARQLLATNYFQAFLNYLQGIPVPPKFYRKEKSQP